MRTLTIITGPRCSGKSSKMREMTEYTNNVFLIESSLESEFRFHNVTNETDFIVIDNVINLNKVLSHFMDDTIIINKQFSITKKIRIPNIIIITQ